jgi:hypothetical protein
MIRAVRSNTDDTDKCAQLASSVVHGLMAGFTGFTVGKICNKSAMIPIEFLNSHGIRRINPKDRPWQRLLACTGQPAFLNAPEMKKIESSIEVIEHQLICSPGLHKSRIIPRKSRVIPQVDVVPAQDKVPDQRKPGFKLAPAPLKKLKTK